MGNAAFKAQDLNLGIGKYQKALRYLHEYPAPLDGDSPELFPQLKNLKIALYSNCALLQNKAGQYPEALESASRALEVEDISDKDKAKAYFRRAQAKIGKKGDEDAVRDLMEAQKYAPGDAGIMRELEGARKRMALRKEKEKKVYQNAFNFD